MATDRMTGIAPLDRAFDLVFLPHLIFKNRPMQTSAMFQNVQTLGVRITLLKIYTEVLLSAIQTSLLQILWNEHWLVKLFCIAWNGEKHEMKVLLWIRSQILMILEVIVELMQSSLGGWKQMLADGMQTEEQIFWNRRQPH